MAPSDAEVQTAMTIFIRVFQERTDIGNDWHACIVAHCKAEGISEKVGARLASVFLSRTFGAWYPKD